MQITAKTSEAGDSLIVDLTVDTTDNVTTEKLVGKKEHVTQVMEQFVTNLQGLTSKVSDILAATQ
jgi:hypothetical protein